MQGAQTGAMGYMFNSMGEKIVGTGGMGQMARKMLKEEHNTTPEQLPKVLAKWAYNTVNGVVNSNEAYIGAKGYAAIAARWPVLWETLPPVLMYITYCESMAPGAQWQKWE